MSSSRGERERLRKTLKGRHRGPFEERQRSTGSPFSKKPAALPAFIIVLRDRLNKRINHEFEKYGIEIPFPQRDLHIKSSVVRT